MTMFPLWVLQTLVFGALALCCLGIATLIVFLIIDSRDRQIW